MNKLNLFFLLFVLGVSCTSPVHFDEKERQHVSSEVQQTLENYCSDIRKSGLMAEFSYLDHSDDFFWVPPGYTQAISYDSVARVLQQNAPKFSLVDNRFITLKVVPLSAAHAIYTGVLTSVMKDTAGTVSEFKLIETGVLIKRGKEWKLLSGQTAVLNDVTSP